MKNSQLLQILQAFSRQELKEFGEFVRSPFFNKNKGVIALYDHMKKCYPEFNEAKMGKETVYGKLYEGVYNDGFMRKMMFSLFNLAEEFIVYKGITRNKPAKYDAALEQYYERGTAELFIRTYSEAAAHRNENKISAEEFYYSYLSSYRNLAFGAEHKSIDFTKFAVKHDLLEPMEFLSAHYYSSAMNLYEYYLNTQHILNFETDSSYFEKLLTSFDKKIIEKYPLLKIHYCMIKMLTEPKKEDYFFESKKLLMENENNLKSIELENIYVNLQNYCMRKIRANKPDYSKELFAIYRLELKRENYSDTKNISVILYRNVIFTALQLKEIKFAESFADNYMPYLPEETREPNHLYAMAHIALKKKEFEKIGGYLSRIKSIDELMKAEIKAMYLPVYYETNAVEQFYSAIDSFKHYLKGNHKLSEDRKKVYETYIKYSSKVMGIKENYDEDKLEHLKLEINSGANTINKGWLLEKLTELESSRK